MFDVNYKHAKTTSNTLSIFHNFLLALNKVNWVAYYPAGNCMFKVNNRNSRTRYKICSKLNISKF